MSSPSPAPSRTIAARAGLAALVLPLTGLVLPAPPSDVVLAGGDTPLPAGTAGDAAWDLLFLAALGTALWLAARAAHWCACGPRAFQAARLARVSTVITVAAGVLANVLLLIGTAWARDLAAAAAVLEFSALLPAVAIGLWGVVTLLWRCVAHSPSALAARTRTRLRTRAPRPVEADDPPAPRDGDPEATRWRDAYTVPGVDPDAVSRRFAEGTHTTGVCLSGGGIRAASVAMGALQSLRAELLSSDYLVSVSGGGYTAGALQQALTEARPPTPLPGDAVRDPASVFAEGTAELHHVRRNSSYLADTPGRMLAALGRIARGLVLSLAVLFGPAVVLGVLAGALYDAVPLTPLTLDPLTYPAPRPGALVALGAVGGAAFLLALFTRGNAHRRARAGRLVAPLATVALTLAVLALAVPLLVWAAAALLESTGRVSAGVAGPVGTVVLTYLAAIASMFWRHRAMLGRQAAGLFRRGTGGIPAALPGGVLQRLLVIVTTGVLAVVWLLLFAGSATTLGDPEALWTAALVAAVVLVLGAGFDVTSLSLHPFYRQRLASAFAVRSVRRQADGQVVAVPYDPAERTSLSRYGAATAGFPKVVFAAAANLTGEARTPPGLNAVSYTMSADWTGGPDVGWVRTADLERAVTPRFRRDLTVQGAVAISGAAFASAMGKASRWFQVLLAVSGARLGAWLPNPKFVRHAHEAAEAGDWAHPWLPRARRLPYLLREVFGIHPNRDRLLHVSDGGHYDNLGLVELFRRRCTLIYCVDASNDPPPTASTFAEALTLARQELGVRVELDEPWQAEAGQVEHVPGIDTLTLAGRLSASPLITGTIIYPPESGLCDEVRGRLVVARAVLWPELPYQLLSYAAHQPEFPNDSTGDQWFDDAKFSAYTELGRHIGAKARAVSTVPTMPATPAVPATPAASTEAAVR
ncbi:patatin-like phospholipase family protein [Prauserella sp. ASG 168]|uniref:Patatin-like phospholipase family protein n=1 Tax=Prauserella cavernicola TaxID=2800127 RepID=A0A934QN42_9PSEU|nr:patatin-like phospholipase family protein [Prauserella cavernicola]